MMHQLCLKHHLVVSCTETQPAKNVSFYLEVDGKNLQQEDVPAACQYFVVYDHLDMVGVQLRSTWTQTRKANGEIVQQCVSNTINPWRSGKFMALTMRPWSLNSYVLSKVWFRCGSVDLRLCDIAAINSSVKSWLYVDLLEKPAETVMCRPPSFVAWESSVSSTKPTHYLSEFSWKRQ